MPNPCISPSPDAAVNVSRPRAGFAPGAASFQPVSLNPKLSPIQRIDALGRSRFLPADPVVSSTYASIEATCPDSCALKTGGCMVRGGFTKFAADALDVAAAGLSSELVLREEQSLVGRAFRGGSIPQDGRRGGRDLRLHVGGDVRSRAGAMIVGATASNWRERGGGAVWSYTHSWRDIPRGDFGDAISVLASVELGEDIERAMSLGYAAAITLPTLPSTEAFKLPGSSALIIPCPAQTSRTTCVECRLCLGFDLHGRERAIAFGVHGPAAKRAAAALVQLRTAKAGHPLRPDAA
jgi:hypothetical protein